MPSGLMMVLYGFTLVCALVAIQIPDILGSIIALSVFGILLTITFASFLAPDVALSQAVINAGLLTSLFLVAYSRTQKPGRSKEEGPSTTEEKKEEIEK